MVGYDPKDPATELAVNHTHTNYTQFAMLPHATFEGKRIGVPREVYWEETNSAEEWAEVE